jgi:gluconate 2-dehydrogenase gamma chain
VSSEGRERESEERGVGSEGDAEDISRREALKVLGAVPLAGLVGWGMPVARRFEGLSTHGDPRPPGEAYAPRFFTAHEYATVGVLADLVIPRDEKSGSATDAKVPEFMDFMMAEKDTSVGTRTAMRGGLAWLDTECRNRYSVPFLGCTTAQRTAVIDDIAWPAKARPEMSNGVAFFNSFRDLTATGFFSSAMGYKDLDYRGNTFVAEWKGCPPAALEKLGVSYG